MSNQYDRSRTLTKIAGIVGAATPIVKLVALFRQQAIASAFGVGDAANAYYYAYIIPGFCWCCWAASMGQSIVLLSVS